MYPRELFPQEKELLSWLLPDSISAYRPYNDFMQSSHVIGEGRWGEGNLILDKTQSTIDLTLGMPPVVAYGECSINDIPLSISVHEFNIDNQLEVQFSGVFPILASSIVTKKWC